MPILPASFIRGSALWRDVAALFNPRCSHDDPIFPRGRDRFCIPVPDGLRFRADAGAGDAPPPRQSRRRFSSAASLECSKEADAKGLHGKERKKFRSECKKTAADKPK